MYWLQVSVGWLQPVWSGRRPLDIFPDAGMEGLPQKTRKVFQLSRLEGRPVAEIAHLLNLSEKAIEYHLMRSLKHLRLHLKELIVLVISSVVH